MKRILSLCLLLLVAVYNSRSCDMCGCSQGGQYLGILPVHYSGFAGLQYQYSSFSVDGYSISGQERTHSFEFAHTATVWARYSVSKRLQFFGFLPWHEKAGKDNLTAFKTQGLGDVSVLADLTIINPTTSSGKWKHNLIAGGGLKAPTGKYAGIRSLDLAGLPNVQAGTGSWDCIANANYSVWRNKFGMNLDASYTLTTANNDGYKYGNRLATSLLGFLQLKRKRFKLLPQVGLRFEYALHDYDNYSKKWLNENSGGSIAYAVVGLQCYLSQFGAKLNFNQPTYQAFANPSMQSGSRLECGLFYLFQ